MDIIKEVLKKVIVFAMLISIILLALNYLLGINILNLFR